METAFGDNLKIRKKDNQLWLVIKLNNSLLETLVLLTEVSSRQDESLILTRTNFASVGGVFSVTDKDLLFDFLGKKEVIKMFGTGLLDINSSKQAAIDYLTTVVFNINKVALQLHDIVTKTETNDPWDDLD